MRDMEVMCRSIHFSSVKTLTLDFWQRFRFKVAVKAIDGSNCTLACFKIWEHLFDSKRLRSFPSIALRIPTAHNFTRDQRARIRKWRLFLYGWTSPK